MKMPDHKNPMSLVLLGIVAMLTSALGGDVFSAAGATPLLILGFGFFGFVLALFGAAVILMEDLDRPTQS